MIIRKGNVLSGREACAKALERLLLQFENPQSSEDIDEKPLTDSINKDILAQGGAMLEKLFDIAESARTPPGLGALRETLGLKRAAMGSGEPDLVARDLRALDTLAGTVDQLTDKSISIELLGEALSQISLPPPRREVLVDVLDVLDARGMRWDHVFLLGLSEGQFPQHFSETSLLSESDRQAWAVRGVQLDRRSDLNAREMLLFYLGISRARKTMTLMVMVTSATRMMTKMEYSTTWIIVRWCLTLIKQTTTQTERVITATGTMTRMEYRMQ